MIFHLHSSFHQRIVSLHTNYLHINSQTIHILILPNAGTYGPEVNNNTKYQAKRLILQSRNHTYGRFSQSKLLGTP